ncbi:hypothetical protein LAZ67_14003359 [Cordylochernes scorpioides]|uniref:GAG-pre-integrase domain-containing protein n=1 Tax=Cordylochernes scorpioides TaxID=51811 RepID=A0ABY6L9H8_9ARAC|nr:hypothetical protein LAZ67_14003359 [Cordylochernes scorpioides]
MLTVAYGEATLDRSNVYRWYKMFSEGREDMNDEERAGRPSTSTTDEKINEVEKMILANRQITVREVAEDLNILIGSCHSIFINDLGMRRVAVKFVPKLLNCDQKQHRMNIANEMLYSVRDDPNLLQRVITVHVVQAMIIMWFKTYTPFTSDHPIYLGDNSTLLAEGMGDIEIQAYVAGGWYNTYIRNVLYSPQLKKNLYSLSTSTRRGFNVIIKHDKLQIFMDNDLKAVGVRHDGLYRMLFKVTSSSQGYITSENKLQLWHERLAHLPVATLREMATKGLVDGLQPQDLEGDFFFCEGCQLGKAHRKSCYPSDGKNYQLVPMDPSVILTKQDCPTPEQKEKMPKFPFREAVGSLMFASCVSRPDITYAVSQNIFRYLKGTPHMGILFTGQDQLVGYSDSDFARDVDSRKSTTGYAFMMNGGTVSWASQRQPIIALSTTESEYIAACSAAKELIWIRRLLQGIGCDITKETELYIDNQAAIKLVENPVFHKRTKHIDVRYHFIRSKHEEGELKVHHVCSSEQLADIITKPLPRNKFHYLRGLLNILDREGVLE